VAIINSRGGTSDASHPGGSGGASSRTTGEAGVGSDEDGGGGGGGGSTGFVMVRARAFTASGALISPSAHRL